MPIDLDDVDIALLDLLQQNARYTAIELAERIGVSDNTVHNRIDRLENAGVIEGYTATVNLSAAGLDRFFHLSCTAQIRERSAVAAELITIPEVKQVTELMTGSNNLHVNLVGRDDADISRVAENVETYPVQINDEHLIRSDTTSPINLEAVFARSGQANTAE